ncbi:Serine/threonine-protein kinase [Podosphaera aphanis]|nr:Serine/threonine-protein kinase [Podosphaera aphanis]
MEESTDMVAPSMVPQLRTHTGTRMERSLSNTNMKEEREDLKEAAEQTLNVLLDLGLNGVIRWASPSWTDVIGTPVESVIGKSIKDLIVSENKEIFSELTEMMKKDNSKSQFVRFSVQSGPASSLGYVNAQEKTICDDQDALILEEPAIIDLEGQGIMVYDRASDRESPSESDSGGHSHSMWMIRPWIAPCEIKIDLPALIVESLGSGAELLASYLTALAENSAEDSVHHTPLVPVLCRICERRIPPWWFEKHTELCLQEHKAEMEVQICQENLTEHRHAIVKVLDALEARNSRPLSGEQPASLLQAEYKGMQIGAKSSGSSSSGTATPGTPAGRSRDSSTSGYTHSRSKSFAVRRPLARIVELLLDLCDTSIEINTPAIKEITPRIAGDFRVQSPQSEGRISQVLQWQSPSTNTLDQEHGLALLCVDTERVAKAKVEAVLRHRRIIEYAERIRIEFLEMVDDCVEEALRKVAKIAAGHLTDSDEDQERTETQDNGTFNSAFDYSSTHLGVRDLIQDGENFISPTSYKPSTWPTSPKENQTTRPQVNQHISLPQTQDSRRYSLLFESDAGGDSDGSAMSSSTKSRPLRIDSPASDFGDHRRATSSRQRHRRSIILPGNLSPRRQESPVRNQQPASPLRANKPRSLAVAHEGVASPTVSPMLAGNEFSSSALLPIHHRRQSSAAGSDPSRPPPSPRLSSVSVPQARAVPPSIKDFEIIKPISKGAFGSVYLAKKKSTGDYYAIKVLKKADMVAKNQVTNVKAERAIMMWQGESDFVAKLYWTFSSKDYLYLVMEYLNGGDCASLIKVLGGLTEDWAKKYLGEVILGVKHLHNRGIVHRDLKPDNLLIDQKGHLKLTDFGLSRMGLIGRQKRVLDNSTADSVPDLLKQGPFARTTSFGSSRSASLDLQGHHSPNSPTQAVPDQNLSTPSYFNLNRENVTKKISRRTSGRSDSSDTLHQIFTSFSLNDVDSQKLIKQRRTSMDRMAEHESFSPDIISLHSVSSHHSYEQKNTPPTTTMMPPPMALFHPDDSNRRFVGTPDYLAPETVQGIGQDETSDWWSVGCILFEFLYGYPPFHAGTPDEVFENILARKISWPDEGAFDVSPQAKDLMNRLLCLDSTERLGANKFDKYLCGGDEIQAHPWFEGVAWEKLLEDEAQFIPAPENPEDTEYFDSRGATLQSFAEEMEDQSSPQGIPTSTEYHERPHDALSRVRSQFNSVKRNIMPLHIPPHVRDSKSRRLSEPVVADDFGNFAFKNLPVLEKANKDVIQKLRAEAMASQGKTTTLNPVTSQINTTSPIATQDGNMVLPNPVQRTISNAKASTVRSSSPSGYSQTNSSPNRASQPSSPLLVSFVAGPNAENRRKASSTSSSLPHQQPSSLTPNHFLETHRMPANLQKAPSIVSSPIKGPSNVPLLPPLTISPQKNIIPSQNNKSSNRARSLTVDSQDSNCPVPNDLFSIHKKRRSQVFDMSPSSSDNEGDKESALLRVQRRRQSSRRMSQITINEGPIFRPLDVLICEDHPVSRMVMEKLVEKLRCRSIAASNGAEAMRYAMGEIKFDIILMEFKLPQINGADVARMIRDTKNANSQTPIVAVTGYIKDLQAPHYFDTLIEKPPTTSKIKDVMCKLCHWKAPSLGQDNLRSMKYRQPSSLRLESCRMSESPSSISSESTRVIGFRGSSRENSVGSSMFGDDTSSLMNETLSICIGRRSTGDREVVPGQCARNEGGSDLEQPNV